MSPSLKISIRMFWWGLHVVVATPLMMGPFVFALLLAAGNTMGLSLYTIIPTLPVLTFFAFIGFALARTGIRGIYNLGRYERDDKRAA